MVRQHYKIDQHWKRSIRRREQAMVRAQEEIPLMRDGVQRSLPPLEPGMQVRVQDADSKVWDRTGIIVEARPHRQYLVKLAGSGRISTRNRRHLRQTHPLTLANQPPGSSQDSSGDAAEPPGHDTTINMPESSRPYREHRRPAWLQDYEM